ncbi:MAG: hypothetical protein J1F16_09125 [Muribaculaceae bacterium]|nr:hypothetical protein [Muribaculaceae bacterium]
MKNLKSLKTIAYGTALIALAPLASCSNEEVTSPEPIVENDGTTLTLYLPDFTPDYVLSRTGEISATENTITDLWFYAIPDGQDTEGKTGVFKAAKIIGSSTTDVPFANSNYKGYTVNSIQQGKYKIYLLANFEKYVNPTSGTVKDYMEGLNSSDAIEAVVLKFAGTNNEYSADKYLTSSSLPMAFLSDKIKKSKDDTNPATTFEFSKTNNSVYADLTIQCAKVRYTVLFDNTPNTGYSTDFYTTNVNFSNTASAAYVISQTTVSSTANASVSNIINGGLNNLPFNKCKYPEDNSSLLTVNPNGTDKISYEPDLSTQESDIWTDNAKKRAWQGTFYFPENPSNSSTTITVSPATGEDNIAKAGTFTLPKLERGKFYDVVAKLVSPGTYIFDVNVYVRINPWEYVGTTPTTW